jgi:hypothetical protein
MGALLLAMLLSQTDGWTVTTTARPLPPPLPSLTSSAPVASDDERWTGYPGSSLPAAPPEPPRVALLVRDPGAGPDARPEPLAAEAADAAVPAEVPAAVPPREESWPLPLASSPEVEPASPAPAEVAARIVPAPSLPAAELAPEPARAGGVEGYQAARWGSSLEEVAGLFPNAAKDAPAQLTTKGLVAGESAETRFFFVDDRLVAVTITFDEAPTRPARYLALYSTVKEGLSVKYGPLAAEKEEWDGEHFRQMDRAMALVLGGLRLAASWNAGATGIALSCDGGELKGRVQINYASLELAPLLQREAQRRQLEGL